MWLKSVPYTVIWFFKDYYHFYFGSPQLWSYPQSQVSHMTCQNLNAVSYTTCFCMSSQFIFLYFKLFLYCSRKLCTPKTLSSGMEKKRHTKKEVLLKKYSGRKEIITVGFLRIINSSFITSATEKLESSFKTENWSCYNRIILKHLIKVHNIIGLISKRI